MTQKSATTSRNREPNPPKLIAYYVTERGRGRKFWTRLGAAWGHKEGEGSNLFMDVIPVGFDGRIVLLPPKATDEAGDQPEGGIAGNDEVQAEAAE